MTAAAKGSRIAWAFDERGARNVYVAQAPDWKARALTRYDKDEGQELTSLARSADGSYAVYVRGGDHGSNWRHRAAPAAPDAATGRRRSGTRPRRGADPGGLPGGGARHTKGGPLRVQLRVNATVTEFLERHLARPARAAR